MNCKALFSLGLFSLCSALFVSCGDSESVGAWDDIYDGPSTSSSSLDDESSSSVGFQTEASSSSSEYAAMLSSSLVYSSSLESSSSVESSSSEYVGDGFVRIGKQIWMDHNLNEGEIDYFEAFCYGGDEANCETYGQLFYWLDVVEFNIRDGEDLIVDVLEPSYGLCPAGTHMPSKAEIEELYSYLQSHPSEMSKITNQLAGYRNVLGEYEDIGKGLIIWSSTPEGEIYFDSDLEYVWTLYYHDTSGLAVLPLFRQDAASVRCLKDDDEFKSSSSVSSSSAASLTIHPSNGSVS